MGKFSPAIVQAWNKTYLASLPDDIRDQLLSDAFPLTVPAGKTIYAAYREARFAIVDSGLARVQALSEDGRAVTVRYARSGQIVGLPSALAQRSPVGAEAVTDCDTILLNVRTIRTLASTRREVSDLLLREVTNILFETIESLSENVFGTVLQRVSRHLLDLAVDGPEGTIVKADQSNIAQSMGSVREVVARAIRTLREEGVVSRISEGILITDPEKLADYANA